MHERGRKREQQILATLQTAPDMTAIEIAHVVGMAQNSVRAYLRRLYSAGRIARHGKGLHMYSVKRGDV